MDIIQAVLGEDLSGSMLIILNLFLVESLLSIDNAAVLATMVMDLPHRLRKKALRYGIIGAYVFRGLCLVFAAQLVKILWLKGIGGLYLLWLTIDYFRTKATPEKEDDLLHKESSWIYVLLKQKVGIFWSTVAMVEVMDLAFSIDNVFAAVAFTQNIYLICVGVFVGILAMRFVAQSFVQLIEYFPFLETVAFAVIGLLGIKLTVSCIADYAGTEPVRSLLNSHGFDFVISMLTLLFFGVPIATSLLFNLPRRRQVSTATENQLVSTNE